MDSAKSACSVIEKELEFNRDNLLNTFDKFFDETFRGQFPEVYKTFGIGSV
jgi:hypothetical protein